MIITSLMLLAGMLLFTLTVDTGMVDVTAGLPVLPQQFLLLPVRYVRVKSRLILIGI